jgi:hypothetical protein
MTENELLHDCLGRLNACGLGYFLTGSMASNYWGVPRSTHDLDFVVQLRAEDVPPLVRALEGDYFIQESSVRSALQPPHQFNAIDQRSALKIDFWVLSDDAYQQEMFARRRPVSLVGTSAWIASAEDVILHKLFWNKLMPSDRQLLDAAGIWAVQATQLDMDYMNRWARVLQIESELERIRRGEIRPKGS